MKKITLENGKTVEISDEIYNNFDQLAPASMPWRAETGEEYWYVKHTGDVGRNTELQDIIHNYIYASGNYYRTEEEAQKEANRLHALSRVRSAILKANDGWKPDWENYDEYKNYITYNVEHHYFISSSVSIFEVLTELPYIASEEIADEIIEDYEEDLKLIFGVE